MSCPEVVYQAYYPYLYQRPTSSSSSPPNVDRPSHFSPFSHQYHPFNVQRSLEQTPSSAISAESYHLSHHSHSSHHSSAGSVSSGGGVGSPGSPPQPIIRYKQEEEISKEVSKREVDEEEDDDCGSSSSSRAQYVSANCVVFTHYSGDVATVVDEHFSKALTYAADSKNGLQPTKEYSPMSTRNFPPSFWNSHYQAATVSSHHSEFYAAESASYHAAVADPWHTHYQQYTAAAAHHHHRAVHDYHHHHNMAAQYSSLLLPATSRLPAHMAAATHQYHHSKSDHWPSSHTATTHHRLHHEPSTSHHHPLDATSSPYSAYPSMSGKNTFHLNLSFVTPENILPPGRANDTNCTKPLQDDFECLKNKNIKLLKHQFCTNSQFFQLSLLIEYLSDFVVGILFFLTEESSITFPGIIFQLSSIPLICAQVSQYLNSNLSFAPLNLT